jgi:hypothetical protein
MKPTGLYCVCMCIYMRVSIHINIMHIYATYIRALSGIPTDRSTHAMFFECQRTNITKLVVVDRPDTKMAHIVATTPAEDLRLENR